MTVPRGDIHGALAGVPGVDLRLWVPNEDPRSAFGPDLDRVSMVIWPFPNPDGIGEQLQAFGQLRLVQAMTAGVDGVRPYLPAGVLLANAGSVHATSTAEWALTLVLAKRRGLDVFLQQQSEAQWRSARQTSLADSRVLIFGAGSIGAAIHDRLLPFEVTVTRVARTAREDARGMVHGRDELLDLLPDHDIVILIAPLTPETHHVVQEEFLGAMPDGALLVNVARGGLVDTDALLAHLNQGRLSAALDVVDPEPLPSAHPLWRAPNVLITPHVGGSSSAGVPRLHQMLRDQVTRIVAGEEPLNLVTP